MITVVEQDVTNISIYLTLNNNSNLKMIPNPQNTLEKIKQQEFYKAKIKEAFNIIDIDRKGYVDRRYKHYKIDYVCLLVRLQRNQLHYEIFAAVPK